MRAIFQKNGKKKKKKKKKKGKILENLGKNVQNLNYFEKQPPHACDYHMYERARICPVMYNSSV